MTRSAGKNEEPMTHRTTAAGVLTHRTTDYQLPIIITIWLLSMPPRVMQPATRCRQPPNTRHPPPNKRHPPCAELLHEERETCEFFRGIFHGQTLNLLYILAMEVDCFYRTSSYCGNELRIRDSDAFFVSVYNFDHVTFDNMGGLFEYGRFPLSSIPIKLLLREIESAKWFAVLLAYTCSKKLNKLLYTFLKIDVVIFRDAEESGERK